MMGSSTENLIREYCSRSWEDKNDSQKHGFRADDETPLVDDTEISQTTGVDSLEKSDSQRVEADVDEYAEYLKRASRTEPLEIVPFVSLDLHLDKTEESYDYCHEASLGESNEHSCPWWDGLADEFPVSHTTNDLHSIESLTTAQDNLSFLEGSGFTFLHEDEEENEEEEYYPGLGNKRRIKSPVPSHICVRLDEDSQRQSQDTWIFDPSRPLIQGKLPVDTEGELQEAADRFESYLRTAMSSENDREDACALLDERPEVAQIRYAVSVREDAPVDDRSRVARHPLTIACSRGHLRLIMAMYRAYPEAIGYTDVQLGSPLHYACFHSAPIDVVEFLVSKFPEATRITNENHQSPLHMACMRSSPNIDIIRLLLAEFPTAAQLADADGLTPLHLALQKQPSVELLKVLIGSSPGVLRTATRCLQKALHVACVYGSSVDVLQFLVRKDPSQVLVTDQNFRVPLHHILMSPNVSVEAVTTLVEAGVKSLKSSDVNDETPLDIAKRLQLDRRILSALQL